jgi:quinol monooxygenase YgiN
MTFRPAVTNEPSSTPLRRRDFLAAVTAIAAVGPASLSAAAPGESPYGIIAKLVAAAGQRDEVIANLVQGVQDMPGCLSYIVAQDASDPNAIWITEAWESKASHDASLDLPSVKAAIAKSRPMIAGFGERFITVPVGGHGLVLAKP